MGLSRYQDFDAWKLTEAFRDEVYRIVLGSPRASSDLRYRSQILDAASRPSADFAEGFMRHSPGDFARFLDYGIGSIAETERRLHDGTKRDYFLASDCTEAFRLARRATTALIRLKQSQIRYRAARQEEQRQQRAASTRARRARH